MSQKIKNEYVIKILRIVDAKWWKYINCAIFSGIVRIRSTEISSWKRWTVIFQSIVILIKANFEST